MSENDVCDDANGANEVKMESATGWKTPPTPLGKIIILQIYI